MSKKAGYTAQPLVIYIPHAMHDWLKKKQALGYSMSAFVRWCVLKEIKREKRMKDELDMGHQMRYPSDE